MFVIPLCTLLHRQYQLLVNCSKYVCNGQIFERNHDYSVETYKTVKNFFCGEPIVLFVVQYVENIHFWNFYMKPKAQKICFRFTC